jgi:hypothetical protein
LRTAATAADASGALQNWASAEDQLANRISMLVTYYRNDPEILDSYATASTLWNEYGETMIVRNAALTRWQRAH